MTELAAEPRPWQRSLPSPSGRIGRCRGRSGNSGHISCCSTISSSCRRSCRDLFGNTRWIAARSAFPGQPLQFGLRIDAFLGRFVRIIVLEFVSARTSVARQIEASRRALRDGCGTAAPFPPVASCAVRHWRKFEAGFGDRHVEPDRSEHILQRAPLGCVIEHIVDRHQPHAGRGGEAGRLLQPEPVVAGIGGATARRMFLPKRSTRPRRRSSVLVGVDFEIGQDGERHAVAPFQQVAAVEKRRALRAFLAQIGLGQQPAKMPPALAVSADRRACRACRRRRPAGSRDDREA